MGIWCKFVEQTSGESLEGFKQKQVRNSKGWEQNYYSKTRKCEMVSRDGHSEGFDEGGEREVVEGNS